MVSEIKADKLTNQSGDQDTSVDLSTNDVVAVDIAGSEKARVHSGGVNIGTTSADASALLTLNKSPTAAFGNPVLQVGGSTYTSGGYYSIGLGYTTSTYTEPPSEIAYVPTADSGGTKGSLVFGTRNATTNTAVTNRMTITSAGLVEMGVSYGYAKLAVDSGTTDGYAGYFHTNTAGGYAVMYLKTGSNVSGLMYFYRDSSAIGSITTNGSSTSFNTTSDYRLKESIDYSWDATTRLKQLKPARFNFKADKDTTVDGFLAHEVSSIVPEAIIGKKDAVDKDGNIEPQGIDQSKLVPLLVKTIQELEARIAVLEAK